MPLIDPMLSLAYSIHTNRGVYALLLGSGVSRAASIPTGWEIVVDLIQKLAVMRKETIPTDPIEWFRNTYEKEPNYSSILEELARTPEERQRLLASYFEATADERDDGAKQPTKAHRAIARLVRSGHLRIIVTTNFDRLIERAIEDEAVNPLVLSSPDSIEGALPLVHQKCCVVKLHGDYLDTRIRNSPEELSAYPPSTAELLDRILDEFGLLICGWSGLWDQALRSAIERCKSRRFTTYWSVRGKLEAEAAALAERRSAVLLQIPSAEEFFSDLSEKLQSLDELDQPHPLSSAAARATVKRLLADERSLIKLDDLVRAEIEKAFATLQVSFQKLSDGGGEQRQRFQSAIADFDASTQVIRSIAIELARWAKPQHYSMLAHIITRFAQDPTFGVGGSHLTDSLRVIPAIMVLYSSGIAAIAAKNWGALAAILRLPRFRTYRGVFPLLVETDWPKVQEWFKILEGRDRQFYPASEWLFANCHNLLEQIIPSKEDYEHVFDLFESIRALAFIDLELGDKVISADGELWGPGGRFAWKMHSRGDNEDYLQLVKGTPEIAEGLQSAGLFNSRDGQLDALVDGFSRMVAKFRHY
jgi:hypothetical protein